MRLTTSQTDPNSDVETMALDWESLGRYVRQRTLEAVAMHFAVMAASDQVTPQHARKRGHNRECFPE
ncbi:MAG: hypothetical protein WBE26_12915 [Phycisphaerae bacterium]